jgi:hypothetical protein
VPAPHRSSTSMKARMQAVVVQEQEKVFRIFIVFY